MNVASALYIVCYVPELYANYKNRNANAYNIPEKIVMLIATGFALSYSIVNQDQSLMLNYVPIFGLDVIAFLMRMYYMRRSKQQSLATELSCTDLVDQSLHIPPLPLQRSIQEYDAT
jgi:uncharacterized protein with PQ loop repeat